MEEIILVASDIFEVAKNYRTKAKQKSTQQISNKVFLNNINNLCLKWFEYEKDIEKVCGKELTNKYSINFEKLLTLSQKTNRKSSFITIFDIIIKDYSTDIIINLKRNININHTSEFDQIFTNIKNEDEDQYLKEAIKCANNNCLKASVVLGWCAAIDKIHKVIEKNGFEVFNNTSLIMSQQTKGRYKNFNQKFNINNISELREVFDTHILWIIEGIGLIDLNQHARLRSCFEMRCHSGHPGEAPISKYNVMSFFSDINEIIFKSHKFNI